MVKTYQGEIKKELKGIPYSKLKHEYLNSVNEQMCFLDLFNYLDDNANKQLEKFIINFFANEFTISEIQEIFNK